MDTIQYLEAALAESAGDPHFHIEVTAAWLMRCHEEIKRLRKEKEELKALNAKMSPDFNRRFAPHNPRNAAKWSVIQSPSQEHSFEEQANRVGGKVYFVTETPNEQFVKIGYTQVPMYKYLSDMQVYNPRLLKILKIAPGTEAVESWFHARFKSEWIRGEWFHNTEEILNTQPSDL